MKSFLHLRSPRTAADATVASAKTTDIRARLAHDCAKIQKPNNLRAAINAVLELCSHRTPNHFTFGLYSCD